jgi:hypothetical protein
MVNNTGSATNEAGSASDAGTPTTGQQANRRNTYSIERYLGSPERHEQLAMVQKRDACVPEQSDGRCQKKNGPDAR